MERSIPPRPTTLTVGPSGPSRRIRIWARPYQNAAKVVSPFGRGSGQQHLSVAVEENSATEPQTDPKQPPRLLLVGCGGIGGVFSSLLLLSGASLSIATTNDAVKRALIERGPRVDGLPSIPPLPAENLLFSAQEALGKFDFVFLAVQPPQLDEVMDSLAGVLAQGGRIVCLSNGLCEERLAGRFGEEAIIGAVVGWGARMTGPGQYVKTSTGGFQVGSLSGKKDEQLLAAARLLERVAPVTLTENLRGARFTKLAINCAVSTLGTIGGSTLGELLLKQEVRALALSILAEAVQVARAESIVLEPVTNLDLDWLVPPGTGTTTRSALQTAARHALLLAIGTKYRHLRSSMLSAIERGRKPSVDYLNGELCRRGRRHGIPTPVNDAARQLVWDIAEGKRSSGMMAIRRVRELANLAAERASSSNPPPAPESNNS